MLRWVATPNAHGGRRRRHQPAVPAPTATWGRPARSVRAGSGSARPSRRTSAETSPCPGAPCAPSCKPASGWSLLPSWCSRSFPVPVSGERSRPAAHTRRRLGPCIRVGRPPCHEHPPKIRTTAPSTGRRSPGSATRRPPVTGSAHKRADAFSAYLPPRVGSRPAGPRGRT